jgi:hypothetical protein
MRDNSDAVDALVLDLLDWIGPSPRPYDEVMDAWRTSCPRLPVWEIANERGLVERCRASGGPGLVAVTKSGTAYLLARRQPLPA